MPIKPENQKRYPANWREIRAAILDRTSHRCEFCGAANHQPHLVTGSRVVLTIAHLDHTRNTTARRTCARCASVATWPL